MFKPKLTVYDLTVEDFAALLHADQRRRANRKVVLVIWPTLLYFYARHLRQKQIRETPEYKAFPGMFKNV